MPAIRSRICRPSCARAADADVLVTIGGASVGDRDLVKPALEARGMALDFWKVAVRPGKPMLFGRLDAQRVLGLPGNPLSCLIAARLFLVPLIFRLLGRTDAPLRELSAVLAHPLEANGPRQHYMRATLAPGAAGLPPRDGADHAGQRAHVDAGGGRRAYRAPTQCPRRPGRRNRARSSAGFLKSRKHGPSCGGVPENNELGLSPGLWPTRRSVASRPCSRPWYSARKSRFESTARAHRRQ